jgi:hypothetical protein
MDPTILIETQGATCVLNKKIENADFVVFDLWHGCHDLIRNEVRTTRFRLQRELLLEPRHGCWRSVGKWQISECA